MKRIIVFLAMLAVAMSAFAQNRVDLWPEYDVITKYQHKADTWAELDEEIKENPEKYFSKQELREYQIPSTDYDKEVDLKVMQVWLSARPEVVRKVTSFDAGDVEHENDGEMLYLFEDENEGVFLAIFENDGEIGLNSFEFSSGKIEEVIITSFKGTASEIVGKYKIEVDWGRVVVSHTVTGEKVFDGIVKKDKTVLFEDATFKNWSSFGARLEELLVE
ncbi:MAG: hypothetical protein LBL47_01965 [Lactobacillus sp.]|nr:hypothetical protein [Lactobacillus sp.]